MTMIIARLIQNSSKVHTVNTHEHTKKNHHEPTSVTASLSINIKRYENKRDKTNTKQTQMEHRNATVL